MSILANPLQSLKLTACIEQWPIAGSFKISRGSKTLAEVVTVKITDGNITGQGECVPYTRYNESLTTVLGDIEKAIPLLAAGNYTRQEILSGLQYAAARNAVDCALWDYLAKKHQIKITELANLAPLQTQITAYTISLDTPELMFQKTREAAEYELLKIKLGKDGDEERMSAVREAAPHARLVADANEGWAPEKLPSLLASAKQNGFELIEQPLPEGDDDALSRIEHPIPICADESCHNIFQLPELRKKYDAINIKLDKTGGIGEALNLAREARKLDLRIMTGCMVGTSLAMAPALYLSEFADWIDLDGPLLLSEDRTPGLTFEGSRIYPPEPALWGY
ncbi:MAG: N-acetyl-D-Glu racemase DgcA [Methyloligellaceae bacterium]